MSEEYAGGRRAHWQRRVRGFVRRLSVSVLNQIVGSGANFVFGLYLVRALAPVEFGIYGICMAVCLLYAGLGNGLLLTQMVVHLPGRTIEDRPRYAASILVLVSLFCVATLMVSALPYIMTLVAGWPTVEISHLIVATSAASIANLVRNYFVRLAYSNKQEYKALVVNTVWAAALLPALLLLHGSGWVSDAASALWIFGAANLTAVALGLLVFQLPIRCISAQHLRHDFKEALAGGRWAIGGVSVTWLQSHSYVLVTTALIGPAGVALANVARLLVAPFTFVLPAMTQMLLPHLAELRDSNRQAMLRMGQVYSWLLVGMGAVYLLLLWLAASEVIPLIIGTRYSYQQIYPLVVAWCAVLVLQLARDGASLILQALRSFRYLMLANSVTAALAIGATAVLASSFGVVGAIVGMGIGEALLATSLWMHVRREGRHATG